MPLDVVGRLKIVDEGAVESCRELLPQFGVESGSMTGTLFGSSGQLHYLTSATVPREFGQPGAPDLGEHFGGGTGPAVPDPSSVPSNLTLSQQQHSAANLVSSYSEVSRFERNPEFSQKQRYSKSGPSGLAYLSLIQTCRWFTNERIAHPAETAFDYQVVKSYLN
ncbi:uncharacterized protein CLUP02_14694 [Colletotrichum lupini]|uniref:Uncharacterized protein n=1 Tax=Colletotrichum lupini TaxID=145971 RepID=A0A9Q8WMY8_9PEZI|nr:uncharacterized protein CLUP02_14694 [Colletotrichum lupini]UQC89166.1 hypothetical protein CLUP02_14694 [Colletotrichum lupini]